MIPATPLARSRTAFVALSFALYLIVADRALNNQDPTLLFLSTPGIAVVATGPVVAREALLRAGLSSAALTLAGFIVAIVVSGRLPGIPDVSLFFSALTGILVLNLIIIVATSAILRRVWPASDHWTR